MRPRSWLSKSCNLRQWSNDQRHHSTNMKFPQHLLIAANTIAVLSLVGCASNPRVVARETAADSISEVSARGPAPTSDEDIQRLRGGRTQSQTTASSSSRSGEKVRPRSHTTETETVSTITDTVIETTPVTAPDEGM